MEDLEKNIKKILKNSKIDNTLIDCTITNNDKQSEIQKIVYDRVYNTLRVYYKTSVDYINNVDNKLKNLIINFSSNKEKENIVSNVFNLIHSNDYYIDTDNYIRSLYGGYSDIDFIEIRKNDIVVHLTTTNIYTFEKEEYPVLFSFVNNAFFRKEIESKVVSINTDIDYFSNILYKKVNEGSIFFQNMPFRDMYDTTRKGERFYPFYNDYSLPYAFTLKFINSKKLEIASYKEADTVIISFVDYNNSTITMNITKEEIVNKFKDIINISNSKLDMLSLKSKDETIPNIKIPYKDIKEFYALGILKKIQNYVNAIDKEYIEIYESNIEEYITKDYKKYKKEHLKKYFNYLKLLNRLKKENIDGYLDDNNKDKKYNINALLNFAKQNFSSIYTQYKNTINDTRKLNDIEEMKPYEMMFKLLYIGGSETKRLPNELLDRLDIDTMIGLQNSILIYNDYFLDEIDIGNIKYWSLYNQLKKAGK